eukprot:gene39089-47557_t
MHHLYTDLAGRTFLNFSASVTAQRSAFAIGVPPDICAFHRYTRNSNLPYRTLVCPYPLQARGTVTFASSLLKEVYNPKAVVPHAALLHQAFAHCAIFPTAASRRSLGRVSVPVWPVTLSGRLPVEALVGHYPTNKLIGREHILHRKNFPRPTHADPVSEAYPQVEGRLLTCYSPVRRSCTPERALPLDLHVLSLPPAFVLSQDQTLKLRIQSLA